MMKFSKFLSLLGSGNHLKLLFAIISLCSLRPINSSLEFSHEESCDENYMTIKLNFDTPFSGMIFAPGYLHVNSCNLQVQNGHIDSATIKMHHFLCTSEVKMEGSGYKVTTRLRVRSHRMLPSKDDHTLEVSCYLDTVPQSPTISTVLRRWGPDDVMLSFEIGHNLIRYEDDRPAGFNPNVLYVVVKLAKRGLYNDMVVRSCMAHDKPRLSPTTKHCILTDFYGCEESGVFHTFVPLESDSGYLIHYAELNRFRMTAIGLHITCGINACVSTCQRRCDEPTSNRLQGFTHLASKGFTGSVPRGTPTGSICPT